MVRKSLLVVVLLAIAAPLAAQDEMVWSSRRPDAQAPFGVVGGQLLGDRQIQVTYRFSQMASKGVWFDGDSLSLETTLDFYHWAPRRLTATQHEVELAYAPMADLTVLARLGYQQREREQYSEDGVLSVASADDLGDLEITGLYGVYDEGPYRAHLQLGATVPTGATEARAIDGSALPYDMRAGSGTFAVTPGLTMATQNDAGSVGAQVTGTFHLGTNDIGYAEGDRFNLNVWAAYRANSFFSVSARVAYQNWKRIEGADPELDAVNSGWFDDFDKAFDPGYEAYWQGGSRMDIPVGINLYMPEGSRFAGHRLSLEYIYPVSQKYDGPQLGADWGLVAGWQVVF
jgi:hypothetical protein